MGRPSTYTEEQASAICEKIVEGKSLRTIGRLPGFPMARTIFKWIVSNEEFGQRYARACQARCDAFAEEIIEISNTPVEGVVEKLEPTIIGIAEDGCPITELRVTERKRSDMLDHRKLQIDARKWVMGKMHPKKYGERIEVEHDVSDGLAAMMQAARERAATKA